MKLDQKAMSYSLACFLFLFLAQVLAQEFDIYWIYPSFDIPMHFLGGVCLGWLSVWFTIRFLGIKALFSYAFLLIIALVTLFGGLVWEVFEFGLDKWLILKLQPSLIDTMLDLVMDLLGAYVVGIWVLFSWGNSIKFYDKQS